MIPTASDYAEEKNELRTVLNSGIFTRAPNLENLLTYVCTKYFEGAAEQIKEYNIAVEALGRLSGFDPKRDSIVRVEAHRLRKRLRDYYEADGAGHAVRIEIPAGQYAPQFRRQVPQPGMDNPAAALPVADPERAPGIAEPAGPNAPPFPRQGPWPDLNDAAAALPTADTERAPEDADASRELAPAAGGAPLPTPAACDRKPSEHGLRLLPPAYFPSQPSLPPAAGRRSAVWAAIAVAALLAGGALLAKIVLMRPGRGGPSAPAASSLPQAATPDVRILAGLESGAYTDRFGRVWQSDRYFQGGAAFDAPDHPVAGTRDSRLVRSRREGTAFSYDIPLAPGVYEMRLYFAEMLYGDNNQAGGGEASRIFAVTANGAPLLNQFDVTADAGASTADIRAFKDIEPAADGKLHLKFTAQTGQAMISAIEITPGTRGRLRPIRLVSRDHPYTDNQGRTWSADAWSRGGQLVMRPLPVANLPDPDLLHGERYGNLAYVFAVPPGRYGVNFYFAETWFGPGNFAGGGIGSRLFDIFCNGVALRRGFDIFKEAGGSGRALVLPVHGLEPNAQGKLQINLVPVRNYASLNALELVDESR